MLGRESEALEADREAIRRTEGGFAFDPSDPRALSFGAHSPFPDGQKMRTQEWSRHAVELYPEDRPR